MDELIETGLRAVEDLVEKLQCLKSEKKLSRDEYHDLINNITEIKLSLQLLQMIVKEKN